MLLSIAKTARMLGVSKQTIRNWIKAGRLKGAHRLIGGKSMWRIPESALAHVYSDPDENCQTEHNGLEARNIAFIQTCQRRKAQ